MTQDAPATVRGGTVLGSGLSALSYGVLLTFSVVLFVGYGGPLWATPGSHGMRFAVSYLSVVPLAALALGLRRKLSSAHLVTAVGTIWAFKLLITAPLYYALAPGGALQDIGALPTARAATAKPAAVTASKASAYEPADGKVAEGAIRGTVSVGGKPVAGVAVVLERPRPGQPLGEPRELSITLADDGFDSRIYLTSTVGVLRFRNRGKHMHTARLMDGGRTRLNAPVPPGGQSNALAIEQPGELEIVCGTHTDERAALIVVDHPYAATTDARGAFELARVPAGSAKVVAIDALDGKLLRLPHDVVVRDGETVQFQLAFDEIKQ